MAMRERPILFSGPMVRAILDGRKQQTRRVVKVPTDAHHDSVKTNGGVPFEFGFIRGKDELINLHCPHGQPGDRLWVKETFYDSRLVSKRTPWTYRADTSVDEDLSRDFAWKPSIFMPRIASRITLEITDVRVERLQEISEEDCYAEGIDRPKAPNFGSAVVLRDNAVNAYRELWVSINGHKSWSANPWVWCLSFLVNNKPSKENS